ncbi:MAG: DUF4097 domain-containing protein [Lachnospiraceae bacterium]|nr:DUF4097 domain-containing protein [Ruminococcus sp.]MCM1275848.1 DUF4097 domain-containing protein [Lachnospiraceae bacterium]
MAEKQIYKFSNEIDEVEVCSLGAPITVKSTDEDGITAEYDNPNDKPEFCAVLCGKKLTLKEKAGFSLFCAKPKEGYAITVSLPKKVYAALKINTASGGADITDESVTAAKFELNTASGNIAVRAFFEELRIKTASGNVSVTNPAGDAAKLLKIDTASGNVRVDGYRAEKFSICSVSGNTEYAGAGGEGDISVTSGTVDVSYEDWNGDLKIGAVSGCIKVELPDDSGAEVQFDGVSGLVKTDLGNERGKFMNLGKGTNGEFGGGNKHKVSVNLMSGTVTLAQRAEPAKEAL